MRRRIFRKIKTKRGSCAEYIGSDSNVATQVTALLHGQVTIALSVNFFILT